MKFHVKYVAKKLGLSWDSAAIVAEMAIQMGRLPDGGHRGTEHMDGYGYNYYWDDPEGFPEAWVSVFCHY